MFLSKILSSNPEAAGALQDFIALLTAHFWLLTAVSFLTYVVYERFLNPLARLPGPFLASLTRLWLVKKYRTYQYHRTAIQLHSKYGKVVRIAPNEVSVGDPEAVKIIYGAQSKFPKGKWYSSLQEKEDFNLLGQMDLHKNRQGRQQIGPVYSLKSIRETEEYMDDPLSVFVKQMRDRIGQSIDIVQWLNVLATDMFTAAIFGQRWGLLERGKADEVLDYVDKQWTGYFWTALYPLIATWMRRVGARVRFKPGETSGMPSVIPWGMKIYEDRLKDDKRSPDSKPDILDKLMKVHKENPDFSEDGLRNQMFAGVFAGFETCGATLPTIVKRVVESSGWQTRLHEELDTAKKAGALNNPPLYDQIVHLPYLTACINEGIRMHPITGIGLARTVPEDGVTIDGHFLPAGTEIGINPWVLSYSDQVAHNPDQFLPDRWINASKEEKATMERCNLAFGSGAMVCPGKAWAMVLIYKAMATLFMNFDIESVDPGADVNERCYFPVKWRGVQMRLRPRTSV